MIANYVRLQISVSWNTTPLNESCLRQQVSNCCEKALFLTSWHMVFATGMTQILAKTTPYLDSRHKVPMDSATYM